MKMNRALASVAIAVAILAPAANADSHRHGGPSGGGRGAPPRSGGGPDYHHHGYGGWYRPVVVYPPPRFAHFPGPFVQVVVSSRPYYYYSGGFYVLDSGGYLMVDAPVGAVVPILPAGCEVVLVGGATYYVHGHTHFRRVVGGYTVVPEPVMVVNTTPAPPPVTPVATPQTWTVWITNANGSKTAVLLQAADGGQWIGPKGEYYDSFPTEQQLLPVYGLAGLESETTTAAQAPAQATPTEQEKTFWLLNRNGSKSKIVLRAGDSGTWIGPRGEVYDTLPTEEQLRPVYGVENADAPAAAGQNAAETPK